MLKIRIRAFRAVDDLQTCERYLEGHRKVLTDYNITQITTNTTTWFDNPSIYGIVVESENGEEVYGGTRIQVKDDSTLLPVEAALMEMDGRITDVVKQYQKTGIGELCGLWNSRKVAGLGYSVLLTRSAIARASIVLADQLRLKSMMVLCGPYTLNLAQKMGFEIISSIGNNGTFVYPRPDLLASALIIKDIEQLSSANPRERSDIFDLRNNPKQIRMELGSKDFILVEYDLWVGVMQMQEIAV